MLGLSLAKSGDRARAAEEFRRAIAIDPRNAHAYNNLGDVFRATGQRDEALEMYRRAIALAPAFEAPRENRAAALDE